MDTKAAGAGALLSSHKPKRRRTNDGLERVEPLENVLAMSVLSQSMPSTSSGDGESNSRKRSKKEMDREVNRVGFMSRDESRAAPNERIATTGDVFDVMESG